MTDPEQQQDKPVEKLDVDPETVSDLDVEEPDADQVRGASHGIHCELPTT